MKMMNEIHSPYSGRLKEVNYKDGDPIGYDEILIVLE
jgi:biotin carboxyl carrier protein